MKIHEIEIENFGTIGKASLRLDDRGLLLVQGENRDQPSANSNGAGKSTVVEALAWALYGKTAKGVTGDAVINRKAGKGCRVSVQIADGDVGYVVHRHRKHPKGKNGLEVFRREDGVETSLTKGTDKLTQEVVDQIMGASHEVFVAAVYAGQEAMPDLPAMTDKELKLLIEEAAGITLLESAHARAKLRLGEASAELESALEGTRLAERDAAAADQRIDDAKDAEKRWAAERDARVIDLEADARTLVAEARALREEIAARPAKARIVAELAEAEKALAGLDGEKAHLQALEGEARAAERRAVAAKVAAQQAVQRVTELEADLVAIQSHVGHPCTGCGRPHDEASLAAAIEARSAALGVAKRDARAAIDAAKDVRRDAETRAERVETYRARMTDATRESALCARLTRAQAELEALEDKLASATKRAGDRVAAIKREKAQVNPYAEKLAELRAALKREQARVEDWRAKAEVARERARVAAEVVRVFGPKGVRAHILDTVTPYLNQRTAHYLGALADGTIEAIWQTLTPTARGELRERFSIDVSLDGGGSFAELSGGEKRRVRLACAMALQDLVASRASKPIGIWIADEIDAALDVAGLERLMNVLEEKARERGTVLVISHTDLSDWCREAITVVKDKGQSSIRA